MEVGSTGTVEIGGRSYGVPCRDPTESTGFALPLVLVALLTLTALITSALTIARSQHLVASAGWERLQARLAAESALRSMSATFSPETGGPGSGRPGLEPIRYEIAGVAAVVEVQAITREWYLLEASARSPGTGAEVRMARILWVLDPETRLSALEAALVHGGPATVVSSGRIELGTLPRAAVRVDGSTPRDPALPGPSPHRRGVPGSSLLQVTRLGLLDPTSLVDRAGVIYSDPRIAGRTNPSGGVGRQTCEGSPSIRSRVGSLTIAGGVWSGILVVSGDLLLEDDAFVCGVVLVGGDLRLESDARIHGAVRVVGEVVVADHASILGSAGEILRALDQSRGLTVPVAPADGSWIPRY